MSQCPIEGCNRSVGFGAKALARDAAVLSAFFPVFDRALEFGPTEAPQAFSDFVDIGKGLVSVLHERVHGASLNPQMALIKDWRKAACESCEGFAQIDPQWFRDYWSGIESRGLKLPWDIYKLIH